MAMAAGVNLLLLMHPPFAADAVRTVKELGGFGALGSVQTLDELRGAMRGRAWDVLLAFGTGVIVPADILSLPTLHAFNIHAATPAYPGRDPHHFAAYDGVREYGATLHGMTPAIDQGPVVAVELSAVGADTPPQELLAVANTCGLRLMRSLLASVAAGRLPSPDAGLRWTGPVRRRADFVALCKVDAQMPRAEFERRLHACSMPGYANLWTEVHGRRFALDRPK
ncbi:formyltransferase family protein [Ramlibacter sp. AN1133]|uniref:formyltransferase family protein n=1 Tax=Ramlibacter sp. AN1133 TaxID=3133429 RepID=UPI0030C32895